MLSQVVILNLKLFTVIDSAVTLIELPFPYTKPIPLRNTSIVGILVKVVKVMDFSKNTSEIEAVLIGLSLVELTTPD